jgi:hypothetical protein
LPSVIRIRPVVQVDVGDPDPNQLGDADTGVHEGADQHDVAGAAAAPYLGVEGAQLLFGRDERQLLRGGGNRNVELGAQVPEHLLEVDIVGPLSRRSRARPHRRRSAARRAGLPPGGFPKRGPFRGCNRSASHTGRSRIAAPRDHGERVRPAVAVRAAVVPVTQLGEAGHPVGQAGVPVQIDAHHIGGAGADADVAGRYHRGDPGRVGGALPLPADRRCATAGG